MAAVEGDARFEVRLERWLAAVLGGDEACSLLHDDGARQKAARYVWEMAGWWRDPSLGQVGRDDFGGRLGFGDEAGVVKGEYGVEWAVGAGFDAAAARLLDDVMIVPVEIGGDTTQRLAIDLASPWEDGRSRGSLDGDAVERVTCVPHHPASPWLHLVLADGDGGHADAGALAGFDGSRRPVGTLQPRRDDRVVYAVKVELRDVDGAAVDAELPGGGGVIESSLSSLTLTFGTQACGKLEHRLG